MNLKERLRRKFTITRLELSCILIVTLLSTLFLITIWPRFLSDAMSVSSYVYIIGIVVFLIPFFKKKGSKP